MRIHGLTLSVLLCTISTYAEPVHGQEAVIVNPFGGGGNQTDEQKQKAAERAKKLEAKKLTRRLMLRINEMKQVCGLSESQVRRLQLAAKGAVRNELKGFEDRLKRVRQMMVGGFVDEEFIAVEEVKEEAKPAKTESPKAKQKVGDAEVQAFVKEVAERYSPVDFMVSGQAMSDIEGREFWKTQVQKTLKPDQRAAYDKFLSARSRFRRRATVMKMVVDLDARLLLTDDQRQKMEKLIDDQLGKFLEHLPGVERMASLESLGSYQSIQSVLARLRKQAKTFLSEDQAEEFAISPSDGWQQFEFLMDEEFMIAGGAFVEVPQDAGFLGVEVAGGVNGVLIQKVTEDQPASKVGLKAGDVITKFNGVELTTVDDLFEAISETKPEDKVKLTFTRDDKSSEVEVTMGSRP